MPDQSTDAPRCTLFENLDYVAPGWGCCICKTYNNAARLICKNCWHEYCGPRYRITESRVAGELAGHPIHVPTKIEKVDGDA